MSRVQPQWVALAIVLCAAGACSQASTSQAATDGRDAAAASTPPNTTSDTSKSAVNAKTFCAKQQPAVQPLVKVPLVLFKASDSNSEKEMHMGENDFVDCDFRQQNTQINVSLHDDSDHTLFDDSDEKGYAPLAGFGDKARYSVKGAMGMRWVDVVRDSGACEARLTMDDGQINGDWKQTAGKMCDAAFAAR
ncbi:MAG: hypothetical protein ABI132_02635 [Rhodanobacteraceae bacterium]